jgi:hypothetical protein
VGSEQPGSADQSTDVPWPVLLVGALLVFVLIVFTIEAYSGRALLPAI